MLKKKGISLMSIGLNIKKRRFELKMSQQELADAMGYKTRSTIAKIESGENDVSQKKLQKFAAVLDTTIEALISGHVSRTHASTPEPVSSLKKHTKNIVILLAGGKSGRNSQNIPSQFINVHGKPIIIYCLEAYQNHPSIDDIYIVCLKGWESIVKDYALQYGISKMKGIIPAGSSGIVSLKKGFDFIKDIYTPEDTVIIQEATRPMISPETISKLLMACYESGSATICHHMNDYVQFHMGNGTPSYIDRDKIVALQSPEAHQLQLLSEMFHKADQTGHSLTESCCTMLLYNLGYNINFIEGNINNIKITREEDIAAFRAMVSGSLHQSDPILNIF